MKQNKQSICLAAPPLRQCVFLGYLLFLLLPACTAGEDGADNDLSGNREKRSCCNPASMPANRRPVLS